MPFIHVHFTRSIESLFDKVLDRNGAERYHVGIDSGAGRRPF